MEKAIAQHNNLQFQQAMQTQLQIFQCCYQLNQSLLKWYCSSHHLVKKSKCFIGCQWISNSTCKSGDITLTDIQQIRITIFQPFESITSIKHLQSYLNLRAICNLYPTINYSIPSGTKFSFQKCLLQCIEQLFQLIPGRCFSKIPPMEL